MFATDVAYAGYGGMRGGDGTGTLSLSGVSGPVTEAYLYWQGPTDTDDTAANATVSFAGSSVTGPHIGTSDRNCWDFDNSQAYRADVTSLVSGNDIRTFDVTSLLSPGPNTIEMTTDHLDDRLTPHPRAQRPPIDEPTVPCVTCDAS